jgi:peptide-methionine (S)-S-oxide reductase
MKNDNEIAIFGAGCFWCVEAAFADLNGVEKVTSGYTGGHTNNPTYKEVCTGTTGHAEVLHIVFNPQIITYNQLLEVFFVVHNPTQLNRQGNDIGTQYRSEIFYTTANQQTQALAAISLLEESRVYDMPVVTKVSALESFHPAEAYHHNYYKLHPEEGYCQMVIRPKVEKVKKVFATLMR